MFWIAWGLVVLLILRRDRRWSRRERWDGWDRWGRRDARVEREALLGRLEEQQLHAESLERRVVELEERLDFTERLLAGRGGAEFPERAESALR